MQQSFPAVDKTDFDYCDLVLAVQFFMLIAVHARTFRRDLLLQEI